MIEKKTVIWELNWDLPFVLLFSFCRSDRFRTQATQIRSLTAAGYCADLADSDWVPLGTCFLADSWKQKNPAWCRRRLCPWTKTPALSIHVNLMYFLAAGVFRYTFGESSRTHFSGRTKDVVRQQAVSSKEPFRPGQLDLGLLLKRMNVLFPTSKQWSKKARPLFNSGQRKTQLSAYLIRKITPVI